MQASSNNQTHPLYVLVSTRKGGTSWDQGMGNPSIGFFSLCSRWGWTPNQPAANWISIPSPPPPVYYYIIASDT
ncbi:hypothetical protein BDA96_08G176500 [Sorghum bicolor]|uniref:Uncharacterized protein n=2 Tax=Sorghum bicolor TaxID=4558 RepID=A0A921QJH1_SORBI|nr:hypothetical protein BDA96_08G176500 [Sorghum bicolor]KXG23926.1 hypothetical protein SORBI_3008G159800 [Sorghum bicolor]